MSSKCDILYNGNICDNDIDSDYDRYLQECAEDTDGTSCSSDGEGAACARGTGSANRNQGNLIRGGSDAWHSGPGVSPLRKSATSLTPQRMIHRLTPAGKDVKHKPVSYTLDGVRSMHGASVAKELREPVKQNDCLDHTKISGPSFGFTIDGIPPPQVLIQEALHTVSQQHSPLFEWNADGHRWEFGLKFVKFLKTVEKRKPKATVNYSSSYHHSITIGEQCVSSTQNTAVNHFFSEISPFSQGVDTETLTSALYGSQCKEGFGDSSPDMSEGLISNKELSVPSNSLPISRDRDTIGAFYSDAVQEAVGKVLQISTSVYRIRTCEAALPISTSQFFSNYIKSGWINNIKPNKQPIPFTGIHSSDPIEYPHHNTAKFALLFTAVSSLCAFRYLIKVILDELVNSIQRYICNGSAVTDKSSAYGARPSFHKRGEQTIAADVLDLHDFRSNISPLLTYIQSLIDRASLSEMKFKYLPSKSEINSETVSETENNLNGSKRKRCSVDVDDKVFHSICLGASTLVDTLLSDCFLTQRVCDFSGYQRSLGMLLLVLWPYVELSIRLAVGAPFFGEEALPSTCLYPSKTQHIGGRSNIRFSAHSEGSIIWSRIVEDTPNLLPRYFFMGSDKMAGGTAKTHSGRDAFSTRSSVYSDTSVISQLLRLLKLRRERNDCAKTGVSNSVATRVEIHHMVMNIVSDTTQTNYQHNSSLAAQQHSIHARVPLTIFCSSSDEYSPGGLARPSAIISDVHIRVGATQSFGAIGVFMAYNAAGKGTGDVTIRGSNVVNKPRNILQSQALSSMFMPITVDVLTPVEALLSDWFVKPFLRTVGGMERLFLADIKGIYLHKEQHTMYKYKSSFEMESIFELNELLQSVAFCESAEFMENFLSKSGCFDVFEKFPANQWLVVGGRRKWYDRLSAEAFLREQKSQQERRKERQESSGWDRRRQEVAAVNTGLMIDEEVYVGSRERNTRGPYLAQFTASSIITEAFVDSLVCIIRSKEGASRRYRTEQNEVELILLPSTAPSRNVPSNVTNSSSQSSTTSEARELYNTFASQRLIFHVAEKFCFAVSSLRDAVSGGKKYEDCDAIGIWMSLSSVDIFSRVFSLLSSLHYVNGVVQRIWKQDNFKDVWYRSAPITNTSTSSGKPLKIAFVNFTVGFITLAMLQYFNVEFHDAWVRYSDALSRIDYSFQSLLLHHRRFINTVHQVLFLDPHICDTTTTTSRGGVSAPSKQDYTNNVHAHIAGVREAIQGVIILMFDYTCVVTASMKTGNTLRRSDQSSPLLFSDEFYNRIGCIGSELKQRVGELLDKIEALPAGEGRGDDGPSYDPQRLKPLLHSLRFNRYF